jgi:hypothetical protein
LATHEEPNFRLIVNDQCGPADCFHLLLHNGQIA